MSLTVPSVDFSPYVLLAVDLVEGRITVQGALDRRTVNQFLDAVAVLENSPSPAWSIDASRISFCDTEGVRGLLSAKRHAARAGRFLAVLRPTPLMRASSRAGRTAALTRVRRRP